MGMSKLMKSLPFRLVLGVAIGIIAGLIANESFMNLVVTLNYIFGQIISFCVPLIVIGFIAPSITKLGKNASTMMVAIGVVISPILRIEGMCPTAHLINITCSVFMGPWYSLLCACTE